MKLRRLGQTSRLLTLWLLAHPDHYRRVLSRDAAWTQVTGNINVGLNGNMHERAVVLAFNELTLPVRLGVVVSQQLRNMLLHS